MKVLQIFNTNTIQNWFPHLAGDKRTHNTDFVILLESAGKYSLYSNKDNINHTSPFSGF